MSLKDLFAGLRKATTDARERFEELGRQIEAARRERDRLLATPPAKDDLKRTLRAWVKATGSGYAEGLQSQLKPFLNRPDTIPLDGPPRAGMVSAVGAVHPFANNVTPQDLDRVLATFFPEQMEAALMSAVDGMSFEEGDPMPKRMARVDALNAEIVRLEGEQMTLINEAAAAGVSLFANRR